MSDDFSNVNFYRGQVIAANWLLEKLVKTKELNTDERTYYAEALQSFYEERLMDETSPLNKVGSFGKGFRKFLNKFKENDFSITDDLLPNENAG